MKTTTNTCCALHIYSKVDYLNTDSLRTTLKFIFTFVFLSFSTISFAQILDLVNNSMGTDRPARTVTIYPNSGDCNGHGINGGIRPCLGCTPAGTNNFPTASDWIAAKGTNIVSGNVGVAKNFIVDVPLVFDNADVRIGSNSTISVPDGSILASTSSRFYACEGLWNGVVAKGEVVSNNSEFEDAKTAMAFTSLSTPATIKNTVFKRNVIGIGFKAERNMQTNVYSVFRFRDFTNNTFECFNPLNLHPDFPYQWGISGITVMGGYLTIPSGNFTGKIRIGIEILDNAMVNVKNCSFVRVTHETPVGIHYMSKADLNEPDLEGYGVVSKQSRLDISKCSFTNCAGGGVHTDRTLATIRESSFVMERSHSVSSNPPFSDLTSGLQYSRDVIRCINNEGKSITIKNNYFTIQRSRWYNYYPDYATIYIEKPDFPLNIINNNFQFYFDMLYQWHDSKMKGIVVNGSGYGSKVNNCIISNNAMHYDVVTTSTNSQAFVGIHLLNTKYVTVSNNKPIEQETGEGFGILVESTSNSRISENSVTGIVGSFAYESTGIKVMGTPLQPARNNIICSNIADEIGSAFVFEGDCDNSVFMQNKMMNCGTRLYLKMSQNSLLEPRIGAQVFGNESSQNIFYFKPNISTGMANLFNDAIHEGRKPSQSLFIPNQDNYPHNPQKVKMRNGIFKSLWFTAPQVIGELMCSISATSKLLTNFEEDVIKDKDLELTDVWNWENKIALLNSVLENPALAENRSDVNEFINFQGQSNLAPFAAIVRQLNTLSRIDEVQKSALLFIENQRSKTLQEFNEKTSQLENIFTITGNEKDELQSELNILANEILGLDDRYSVLIDQIAEERIMKIRNLRGELMNISTIADNELDFKILYMIVIDAFLSNGKFADDQINLLSIIAEKCPSHSGSSVYQARQILEQIKAVHYDNISTCDEIQAFRTSAKPELNNIKIFPNPSDQVAKFQFEKIEGSTEIELFDIAGKLIFNVTTEPQQDFYSLDTSKIPSGTYFVYFNGVRASKIVIQH
ncbi:MAG: T9SS type A sorting domain-containing protein [Saprospiraceae bacterium]